MRSLPIRVFALSALIAIVGTVIALRGRSKDSGTAIELSEPVPAFSFVERSGKTIENNDLLGKVWVASFVFTRCNGPCPAVSATVANLQDNLHDLPNVRFVTFTIDPDRDTPNELKQYAERFRADSERWLFLSGPEATMQKFATGGFKLLAARKTDPKPGDEFDHSTKLAVVDSMGKIRGYFDGMPPPREGGDESFTDSYLRMKQLITRLHRETE